MSFGCKLYSQQNNLIYKMQLGMINRTTPNEIKVNAKSNFYLKKGTFNQPFNQQHMTLLYIWYCSPIIITTDASTIITMMLIPQQKTQRRLDITDNGFTFIFHIRLIHPSIKFLQMDWFCSPSFVVCARVMTLRDDIILSYASQNQDTECHCIFKELCGIYHK